MIVLGILAILMAIGYPAFQRIYINSHLRSAVREMVADFNLQRQRAMSGDSAAGGARIHRVSLNLGAKTYTLERCATTDNTCPGWETMDVKDFSAHGSDIDYEQSNPAWQYSAPYDFYTRGTLSERTIVLTNSRGSTAVITSYVSGRTFVEFKMQ